MNSQEELTAADGVPAISSILCDAAEKETAPSQTGGTLLPVSDQNTTIVNVPSKPDTTSLPEHTSRASVKKVPVAAKTPKILLKTAGRDQQQHQSLSSTDHPKTELPRVNLLDMNLPEQQESFNFSDEYDQGDDDHYHYEEEGRSKTEGDRESSSSKPKHWTSSKNKAFSHTSHQSKIPEMPSTHKQNGKFTEIPHLLDGFLMLNHASADDPKEVYSLQVSKKELEFIIEDDLAMFLNLSSLDVSENTLPFAKLGILPSMKKLNFSCNGLKSLDLESDGRFKTLEYLDLSFNNIDKSAQIVVATFPKLKYLDLTRNKIKSLALDAFQDMSHWRDQVIELILPLQVAAMGLEASPHLAADFHETKQKKKVVPNSDGAPSGEPAHSSKHDSLIQDHPQYNPLNVGFQCLETLILENNPLGSSMDIHTWIVLGRLPSLRKLNLNKTGLKTLEPLIPQKYLHQASNDLLQLEKSTVEKYDGFQNLLDLHLADNLIKQMDELVGFIFLPKLQYVYVGGNLVMQQHIPRHLMSKRRLAQLGPKIIISDSCYLSPFQIGKQLLGKKEVKRRALTSREGLDGQSSKKGMRQFLHRHVNVSSNHMEVAHTIKDSLIPAAETMGERRAKRQFQFSDQDLEEIVKTGHIPSVKTLVRLAHEKESGRQQEKNPQVILEGEEVSMGADEKMPQPPHEEGPQVMSYDPHKTDKTFITGVHITGGGGSGSLLSPPKQDFRPQFYEDEEEEEDEEDILRDIPLPKNISATVRTLRLALKNPGYWRGGGGAGTTSSSLDQKLGNHLSSVEKGLKSNIPKTVNNKIPAKSNNNHNNNKTSFLNESITRGQAKAKKNEFDEMQDIMTSVQGRLTRMESTLMSVTNSHKFYDKLKKETLAMNE